MDKDTPGLGTAALGIGADNPENEHNPSVANTPHIAYCSDLKKKKNTNGKRL